MGKGSKIPYSAENAIKVWAQVMKARYRCGLEVPPKADPMKGWQQCDFEAAVPEVERYSWSMAYLYLQLTLTEEWKASHSQWVHFDLSACRMALGLPE